MACSSRARALAQSPLEEGELARSEVGHTDGGRMLRRLSEPDRFGCILGCRREPAELGEAQDQPEAIEDGCRHKVSERLVDPVGGQRREVVGGQLDHPLVLAPIVMRLFEKARTEDAERQVSQHPCNFQRPRPARNRLLQLAEVSVGRRHDRTDTPAAVVVVQALGDGLGPAQALQPPPGFTELVQHRPQLEADVEGLLQCGLALGERLEDTQRLLKPDPSVRKRRLRCRFEPGLPEIVHRLLPQLAP